jgi:glycosyltransferase involved in cell wall biosynthesis
MKIAAIHNLLDKKRGAEFAFLNMVLSLKKRGHDIDVFVFDISDEFKEEFQKNGINVTSLNFKPWRIKNLNAYLHPINVLRVMHPFYKLSKEINKNYDVAFVHHYYFSPCILPVLSIPKVYYCHEPPRGYYEPILGKAIYFLFVPYLINRRIDKFCVKHADLILTNSDYEREYIWRTYGLFPITNRLAVDLNKFIKLNFKKENFVLSIGVIVPVKAPDFVIRSVALIPKSKRPKVVIVGSSGDKVYIEKLGKIAKEKKVELEIKINVSDEELVKLYNKARVTTIAYIMEPSIEPESLGCETPIVAVREAGARETIINGETGILTNRDEREFAKAIEYLLDHPDVAAEMGRKGREWIEKNFTWEKCAENLERNFMKVLDRKI